MLNQCDDEEPLKDIALRVVVISALAALATGLGELAVNEIGGWIRRSRKGKKSVDVAPKGPGI